MTTYDPLRKQMLFLSTATTLYQFMAPNLTVATLPGQYSSVTALATDQVCSSLPKNYPPQSHRCPLLSATFAYGAPRLGFAQ